MSTRTAPTPVSTFPASMPPSANTSGTCCPKMAGVTKWFGSPAPKVSRYAKRQGWAVDPIAEAPKTFGFDDRTNLPVQANRGTDEYWNRGGAPGISGGVRDLDGSAWVGVAVGGMADVELRFVGQSGTPCIGNVSIAVSDPAKAVVTPTSFTAARARLAITGSAPGDVTITLSCNGKPIGWCHASIMAPKVANVTVYRINLQDAAGADLTPATPFTPATILAMADELNQIYAQCAVTWSLTNGGVVTYTSPTSVSTFNATLGANSAPNIPQRAVLLADIRANSGSVPPVPVSPAINLYYMEAPASYGRSGGFADGIGGTETIIYATPRTTWDTVLLGHELGHCLDLRHPNDAPSVVPQLPDNFRLPLAVGPGGAGNGMFADHNNLMGYGQDPTPMATLRYDQWKVVRAKL